MERPQEVHLSVLGADGRQSPSVLELATAWDADEARTCAVTFRHEQFGEQRFEGNDYFAALVRLRYFLEERECRILCQGARKEAHPSAMQRDTAEGLAAYILHLGRPGRTDDVVNTFAEVPAEQVGTIEQQRAFYQQWLQSLGWPSDWMTRSL
jgi:hypothetical protein